jgi:hypothetical protein
VFSKDYVSIWNCKTDELITMTIKEWNKMNDKEEKKNE